MRYTMPKYRPARRTGLRGWGGCVEPAQAAGWRHDRAEALRLQAELMAQATTYALSGDHDDAERCLTEARLQGENAAIYARQLTRFGCPLEAR